MEAALIFQMTRSPDHPLTRVVVQFESRETSGKSLVILNPLQRVKNPGAACNQMTVWGFFALCAQNDMGLVLSMRNQTLHRNLYHYPVAVRLV